MIRTLMNTASNEHGYICPADGVQSQCRTDGLIVDKVADFLHWVVGDFIEQ